MKTTLYPSLTETIELHVQLIQRFGGKAGVRDYGLLESALIRPQTGYYKSLSLQGAALMQSLAQNHPFIDGNKRVAFAATAIFLRLNGYRLKVDADNAESFLIDHVIKAKVSIEVIADWLEMLICIKKIKNLKKPTLTTKPASPSADSYASPERGP